MNSYHAAYEDFNRKFQTASDKAAHASEQGFGVLTKSLRGLLDLQSAEIERLRGIIERAENLPERRPVALSSSSYETRDSSAGRTDVTCLATDGSAWILANATRPGYSDGWQRLPDLPQAVDEMNDTTPRAYGEGDDE